MGTKSLVSIKRLVLVYLYCDSKSLLEGGGGGRKWTVYIYQLRD